MSRPHSLCVDVLVVGGGPAGSACATVLARGGVRVAVVEGSTFERFRIGETIAAPTRSLLARLGLACEGDWGLPSAGVAAAWGQDTASLTPSIMNPYGHGWRVDRRQFDRRLFDHAGSAGAALFTGTRVVDVRRDAAAWKFAVASGSGTVTGRAEFVVEATGRTGTSRFTPQAARLWVDRMFGFAVQGDCTDPGPSRFPESAAVEAVPGGWWYSVYLPSARSLAVYFTDSDLLPPRKAAIGAFLREQLQEAQLTRGRCPFLERSLPGCPWQAFDARSGIRRMAGSEGWIAAGDALMAFDPLCGRGVTEAIESGINVAERFLRGLSGGIGDWADEIAVRFNDYLRQRLRTYRFETRWSEAPFWQRRRLPTL